jgi:DNA-binding winged helix-turn-helix (wHTH) protein
MFSVVRLFRGSIMESIQGKTLVFGKSLADKLLEIANPQNLVIIDGKNSDFIYDPKQPVVALIDAFRSIGSQTPGFTQCLESRSCGFPTAIMGVLTWETLRRAKDAHLNPKQLSAFDDLLLLPAKAFEFDLRFAKLEQVARLRSKEIGTKLAVGPLVFDVRSMSVEVNGKHLRLTRKETEFLLFMARNANEVVSKERIARAVWQIENLNPSFENVLNGHVSRLREKLGDAGCWGLLRTVRRIGLELSPSMASFHAPQQPALS